MTLNGKRIGHWSALACALVLAGGTLAACGSSSNSSNGSSYSAPSGDTTSSTPASSGGGSTDTTSSSSGGGGGAAAASTVSLSANESGGLSFDKQTLTAKAGTVTIKMTSPSGDQLPHGIAVEGNGVDKDGATVQPGGTSTVTVKLKPGTYSFYCPVSGHKDAGMKGTLTVQ